MVNLKELTTEDIEGMKVAELREVAAELGVSTKGLNKGPLQAALIEALGEWQKEHGGGGEDMAVDEAPETEKPAEAMEEGTGAEEGGKEKEQEEEQVAPLTTQNLKKQLEEQAASSDTISEASRVATVDAGSVRDDTRSLSSAVAGDEEAAANGADTGKEEEAAKPMEVEEEGKKSPAKKAASPPKKPKAAEPPKSPSKSKLAEPPKSPPKSKPAEPPKSPPKPKPAAAKPAAAKEDDREVALKEKLKAKIQPKTTPAPAPAVSAEEAAKEPAPPAQNPVSCTVRVDGFVRPFMQPKAKALVMEKGGGPLVEDGFWMDSIKTHCYATFEKEEHAVRAREALYNLVWPERGGTLKAEFAPITAIEANKQAAEARAARFAPKPAAAASGPSAAFAAKSLEQANSLPASASNGSLSRGASSGLHADQEGGAAVRRKRELGPSPDRDKRVKVEGEEGGRRAVGQKKEEAAVTKQPTFDDLFRATKTKPKLYYQTVEEEVVLQKRKRLVELKAREKERRASGGASRR